MSEKKENLHQLSSWCHTQLTGTMCKSNVACGEGRCNLALRFEWLCSLQPHTKSFECNGCFLHVCPICYWKETPVLWQKGHMAICTIRKVEYFSQTERIWNQNRQFNRDLTRKIFESLHIIGASDILWFLLWK